jgi:hypothetical protein
MSSKQKSLGDNEIILSKKFIGNYVFSILLILERHEKVVINSRLVYEPTLDRLVKLFGNVGVTEYKREDTILEDGSKAIKVTLIH